MSNKVIFYTGKREKFDALATKDPKALYWLTDTQELYAGDILYGKGAVATNMASGLMSAADKQKLDELTAGVIMKPLDSSVTVEDGKVGVLVSKAVGNILSLKDDGLFVASTGLVLSPVASNGLFVADDGLALTLATPDSAGAMSAVDKQKLEFLVEQIDYEITAKPDEALVNRWDKEIRIMCPADTEWQHQNVGAQGNADMWYIGFKAYAPSNAVSFREDLAEVIADNTQYYFEDNEFAGIDSFGRKYSIVWLPVASYDSNNDTWKYYGAASTEQHYIGWYYSVEWYDTNGKIISADTIRINLSNEACHRNVKPYYLNNYASTKDLEECLSWGNL